MTMIWTISLATFAVLTLIIALWVVGRRRLAFSLTRNFEARDKVIKYHNNLMAYVNSGGKDEYAFSNLMMQTSEIERVLGYDNYVHGVKVGNYLLNTAPILPIAIHEMRRQFGDFLWEKDAYRTADVLRSVVIRHLGSREETDRNIRASMAVKSDCIAEGWFTIAALPLALLRGFGLLSGEVVTNARSSILFRFWSLLLAMAAFAGPLVAYLADKAKIDSAVKTFLT